MAAIARCTVIALLRRHEVLSLEAARDAAHTLRGTAAFYHLAQLRQTTTAVEEWLHGAETLQQGPSARRALAGIRSALDDTLAAMRSDG